MASDSAEGGPTSLVGKVIRLVQDHDAVAHPEERILTAWVLLTRMTTSELRIIWMDSNKYKEILEGFAERLIKTPKLAGLGLLLVCPVAGQLVDLVSLDFKSTIFRVWKSRDGWNLQIHIAMLECVEIWMEQIPTLMGDWDIFSALWNHFVAVSSDGWQPNTEMIADLNDQNEWKTTNETLRSLLEAPDSGGLQFMWNDTVFAIFQAYASENLPSSLIKRIICWIVEESKKEIPKRNQNLMAWQEWWLLLLQTRVPSDVSFRSALIKECPALVNDYLMALVVSPVNERDTVRALAWQAIATVVTHSGWDWLFDKGGHKSSEMGRAKLFCTWIRLASGEWRIQLEQSSVGDDRKPSAMLQATTLPIGYACARILMSSVSFLIQSHDTTAPLHFSGTALLHIQQSLQDTLRITVQYLNRIDGGDGRPDFTVVSTQLLCILLREVDIWQTHFVNTGLNAQGNVDFQVEVVCCVENLLTNNPHQSEFFPGIVSVLSGAEGNSNRIALLQNLWDILVDFLRDYWSTDQPTLSSRICDENLVWACACAELWASLDPSSKSKRRMLSLCLVQWIQEAVQGPFQNVSSSQLRSALSLVAGCYMTLEQGRLEPPKEHENRVILRALEICEASD